MQTNSRPFSLKKSVFEQKSKIIRLFGKNWEGTFILVVFLNFSRHYRLCSYIIQFYSERIEVPKRMKLVKYGLLSAISDYFGTFFPQKSQISVKSLTKFGNNENASK